MCGQERRPLYCIVPPYMLERLAESPNAAVRRTALEALTIGAAARAMRAVLATLPMMSAIPSLEGGKERRVYDLKKGTVLPGTKARFEGEPPTADNDVNRAYDYSGKVYDFYNSVFKRNSLDGKGMALISSVHLGVDVANAFWNGEQMEYGDGDADAGFESFTRSLDVAGHEMTHGVVTHTCNLEYQDEPGALNEHFADVFGILTKQWRGKQTAASSDWLIGAELMVPRPTARALRTFKDEKAYDADPLIGSDPQPKHMSGFYTGSGDYGGVHINSGIPNHAFYRLSIALGGNPWLRAGRIWYRAMTAGGLTPTATFVDMVKATTEAAATEFGAGSKEEKAVRAAWKAVGL